MNSAENWGVLSSGGAGCGIFPIFWQERVDRIVLLARHPGVIKELVL